MVLFVWVNFILTSYVWFKTFLDVYHPLASNINSAASQSLDPRSLLQTVQSAILGSEVRTNTPRRRRGKREMTLESSEREELRSALKVLVVWLMLRGLEPLFDNTLGWVIPLYALAKTIVLVVFVRFRVQLALHLFRTFVEPLGRPNEPLIDAGALNSVLIPAIRFLLSLPLAHLTHTLRDRLGPSLMSFFGVEASQRAGSNGILQTSPSSGTAFGEERVRPPSRPREFRTSEGKSNSPGVRPFRPSSRGGGGGGSPEGSHRVPSVGLSKQSSSASLRKSARDSESSTMSDRMTPTTKATASLLASLPPAPSGLPQQLTASGSSPPPFRIDSPSSRSINSASTSTLPRNFAFIPPSTSVLASTSSGAQPIDAKVQPLSQTSSSLSFPPSTYDFVSPKMPGFLFGQQTSTANDEPAKRAPPIRVPLASLSVAPLTESLVGDGRTDAQSQSTSTSQPIAPVQATVTETTSTRTRKGKRKASNNEDDTFRAESVFSEDIDDEKDAGGRGSVTPAPTDTSEKVKRSPRKKQKATTKDASVTTEAEGAGKSNGRVAKATVQRGNNTSKTKEAGAQSTATRKKAATSASSQDQAQPARQGKATMTRSRSTAAVSNPSSALPKRAAAKKAT